MSWSPIYSLRYKLVPGETQKTKNAIPELFSICGFLGKTKKLYLAPGMSVGMFVSEIKDFKSLLKTFEKVKAV